MPSFVFWNAQRGSRLESIRGLAEDYEANFLMIAEGGNPSADILVRLNTRSPRSYRLVSRPEDRVMMLTTYGYPLVQRLDPIREARVVVFRVESFMTSPFLLAAVHLRSKRYGNDPMDQIIYAGEACREIACHESATGIDRTVVVGDFNMDPYEAGMVSVDGFHAIMDRRIVTGPRRQIGPNTFDRFYNPMWSLMGDLVSRPPGSHYYLGNRRSPYWHMFDQVLLRPGLIPSLVPEDLELVATSAFAKPTGRPGGSDGSDHFPLRFTLDV